MKVILQLSIFLFSIGVFACTCSEVPMATKFMYSDFVSEIEIVKIYPNEKGKNYYRSDIKIKNLFKGNPINSVYIYGRNNNEKIATSCDLFIPENTKLIAFARKNTDGLIQIHMCLMPVYETDSDFKEKVKLLKTIDTNEDISTALFLGPNLDSLGIDNYPKNSQKGIYIVEYDRDSKVNLKQVKIFLSFGKNIDDKIVEKLKKIKPSDQHFLNSNKFKALVIVVFYEDKEESFFVNYY